MERTWPLEDAQSRLNDLIEDALRIGPQIITNDGIETAVVLSMADYRNLAPAPSTLSNFFQNSPLAESEVDLQRFASPDRHIEFD